MRTMVWRWNGLAASAGAALVAALPGLARAEAADVTPLPVDDASFKCISEMRAVSHYYVDKLLGNVEATVPFTREMFGALQRTDPRCRNRAPVSEADAQALKQLGELVQSLTGGKPAN